MADLTPEERAGLRQVAPFGKQSHGRGCGVQGGYPCDCTLRDTPLYTLDAERLAELLRRHDEAVALLRDDRKLLRTTYGSKAGFAHEAQMHVLSVEAFLAALDREDPK